MMGQERQGCGFTGGPLEDKKMNWGRGLKRIALVLSILGAITGGSVASRYNARQRNDDERGLAVWRQSKYSEYDARRLIDDWKKAKTFEEQDALWVEWTGERLPTESFLRWQEENRLQGIGLSPTAEGPPRNHFWENDPVVLGRGIVLIPTPEEVPRLKEQGWVTVTGEPLPLTPAGVWLIRTERSIRAYEAAVSAGKIEQVIITLFGTGLGFGVMWALYALTLWIAGGFREDKQKDGQGQIG
jgi:hypothetical protein